MEDQTVFDSAILSVAYKALGFYKLRSENLKGIMHKRMEKLIHFHISECLRTVPISAKDDPLNHEGPIKIPVAKDIIGPNRRKVFREKISDMLVKEAWIPEGIKLVEKAKKDASNLQEYFYNEIKVLVNDSIMGAS